MVLSNLILGGLLNYSVDVAYVNYFQNASQGRYANGPLYDRLTMMGLATGSLVGGSCRLVARIVTLVIEIVKVSFYAVASLITLGGYGNIGRLSAHCKLVVIDASFLIAQPLQLAAHALAVAIGIVRPKAGYKMMQLATAPLASIASKKAAIWQSYKQRICFRLSSTFTTALSSLIDRSSNHALRCIAKTIITEFSYALSAALVTPLGLMSRFHCFDANPKNLTDKQKTLIPILLLNGNYSHQATFLPLLHALKASNNTRPVYTINLPPNTIHPNYISGKIADIRAQYGQQDSEDFAIDMVGHSMGANLINNLLNDGRSDVKIKRAISVGTPFRAVKNRLFDIIAKFDVLQTEKSNLLVSNQCEIATGHLGLLHHHKSIAAIKKFLNA